MSKTKYVINSTTSLSNMTTWLQKTDAIIEIACDRSLANAERNLPIAGKLSSVSTFYDTTLGKMYHLNNSLQWVE